MAPASATSPAPSTHSGTTTVPNTPIRQEDERPSPAPAPARDTHTPPPVLKTRKNEPPDNTSFSSSSDSHDAAHDIKPTWPRRVDVINMPALVSWQPDAQLDEASFEVHWVRLDNDKCSAFFKIIASIPLESSTTRTRRDGHVRLYLFIPPERIRQLALNAQPHERPLGPNTISLAFEMIRPAALVLPKEPVSAAGRAGEDTLRSLHTLVAQLSFTVHTSVTRQRLPVALLQEICAMASAGRLSSIERLAFPSVPTLYKGHGAQVIEGDALPGSKADTHCFDNPPAYDNETSQNLLPSHSMHGKKRRRSSVASRSDIDPQPMDHKAFEALLDARLSAHKLEVTELHRAHKSEIMELISAHMSDVERRLAAHKAELEDKIATLGSSVREEVVDGLTDFVDEKVREEMEEVSDYVMDRITSMPLRAELTFPDHPTY